MTYARVVLWLAVAMFGLFGAWLLIEPSRLDEWLGLHASTAEARTEIRAFYGGIELALAAFFALCACRPAWLSAGLVCLVFVSAGLAAGRIVGFALDGSASPKMFAFLATELVFAALAAVAWSRS